MLARKWRPKRFTEMVGQEHVLKALVNALDDDRLHHAYLFTGTRGVGKTSIARLFAKSLNCETGVSSEPCGQCGACIEIAEGRFVDLIEVDAASRTKVEDTRELLENVQYAPTHGRFKVYLIDEVHMLSTSSFNALLKTLEEPPPHVKFLLATTDPQKLPVTVLSRCLQFNLKNLIPEKIVNHLAYVLNQEQIRYEEPALWLLARSADGSMRDALSLTDQSIAFGAGAVIENDVRAMLGTIDQRLVYRMLDALVALDPSELLASVSELAQFSPDYMTVLGDLISLLHRVAVAQVLPEAVDNSMGDQTQVSTLAQKIRPEDIQLYYQIALMGRKDLPFAPDAREGLEMILLRMLAFRPADAKASSIELSAAPIAATSMSQQDVVTQHTSELGVTEPESQPQTQTQTVRTVPELPATPEKAITASDLEPPPYDEFDLPPQLEEEPHGKKSIAESLPAQQLKVDDVVHEESLPVTDHPVAVQVSGAGEVDNHGLPSSLAALQPSHWVSLLGVLGLSGMTASIASNLSLESVSESQLQFHFRAEQEALLNDVQQQRIEEALASYFQQPLTVVFHKAVQTQETPADYFARLKAERLVKAINDFETDPHVQQLLSQFGGMIIPDSIYPIDP